MADRSVTSLEALVRWKHPQLGAVSPAEFVPLAESTGGSRRLTNWVLGARPCASWASGAARGWSWSWRSTCPPRTSSIPDLGDALLRLLRAERVEPAALMLEITESAVMRDPQVAVRNMQLLRLAGLRFAIDDFGTGHSSLSQLACCRWMS